MATRSLVFIPFPILSHLAAAVKTAELLAARDGRLSITFLVMSVPTDTKINSYVKNPTHPRINFVQLEQDVSDGAEPLGSAPKRVTHLADRHRRSALAAVSGIMSRRISGGIAGIFVDILCVSMIDVAKELELSSYVFFPSGAAMLGLMFDLQSLHDDGGRDLAEFEDSDAVVSISSYANPVPARVWPDTVFDGESGFLDIPRKARLADGIVVNTFLELESYAIGSTRAGARIPRFYPIGPIIGDGRDESGDNIVRWLDGHPASSVVFLCFGSLWAFGAGQVAEIARALEAGGWRFLWSLRKPGPGEGLAFPTEYEDPGEVLPEGFLERTAGVGRVIGWAPQRAVLAHPSVGGFVSHCGWNSTLESVSCGVPIAAWPSGAEQHTNAFQLVNEIGIAVEIKMDYRKKYSEIVKRDVIEKTIKLLMDPTNEIRVRVKELKEESIRALMEGGSSYKSLDCLIQNFFNC